jgi:8-oxo-dGTP pyrophosphatase MutT (NUDIX family)
VSDVPIYKVGLIALRHADGAAPQVLLVKPKPKQNDPAQQSTVVPWVLPRGSRCYKDTRGIWQDVRSDDAAVKYKDRLEPLIETLLREAEEEAGVPADMLRTGPLYDFGVHEYRSRPDKPPQRIQFYVLPVTEEQAGKLNPSPEDASTPPRWVTRAAMQVLAAAGDARAGYVPIVEGALQALTAGTLPRVTMCPPPGADTIGS